MHKLAWYYRQPVIEDDVNFAFDSAEDSIRDLARYAEAPAGIVGGYDISPSTGLDVTVETVSGVMLAIDRQGRAIRPTAYPWTQSIAATTEGSSTAVGSGGNERWVSLFIRGGRSFVDAATDGFGNSVRKTALETVNALGEVDHPAGAYDGTAALEDGVGLLYVTVGIEAPIGTAVRPSLLDDAILAADIRLVNGQSTLAASDIFLDRRERIIPDFLRVDTGELSRYAGDSTAKYGVLGLSTINRSGSGLTFTVIGGRGYVQAVGGATPDRIWKRYDYGNTEHVIPAVPPHASMGRKDLLLVDADGGLRILAGTPSTDPVAPAVPSYTVPLAEIYARQGTTNTSTWPVLRRSGRRLPYPYSTAHGILEGCKLQWRTINPGDPVLRAEEMFVRSKKNKLVFDGEVVEFTGGYNLSGQPTLKGVPDVNASPFSSGTFINTPYYVYACRTMTFDPISGFTSPVTIIESLTPPIYPEGFPSGPLRGSWGQVAANDCLLIGVGWTWGNNLTVKTMVRHTDDDWFFMMSNQFHLSYTAVANGTAPGSFTLISTPQTGHCTATKVSVSAWLTAAGGASGDSLTFYDHESSIAFMTVNTGGVAHGSASIGMVMQLGQYDVPAIAGQVRMASTGNSGVSWRLYTQAVKMELPRVHMGVGAP